MIRDSRTWGITMMLVVLALAVTPAFAQPCAQLDNGEPRPQFMLDRMPECGGIAPAGAAIEGANMLTTLFAANNGGAETGGVYFDLEVVGADDLVVNSWDINLDASYVGDVSVWFRDGTFSGFETSPAGWTLVGTAVGVASAGNDVPTPVDVGATLDLAAGSTTGIAISLTPTAGTTGHIYTNGTGGNEIYNDGMLELRAGSANNTAFSSSVFSPRVWNGTVYYDIAGAGGFPIPTLSQYGLIALLLCLAAAGFAILRRP